MLLNYIIQRCLQLIPLLIAISIIIFIIIQLPPGDYLTTYIQQLKLSGTDVSLSAIENLKKQYSLDQPAYIQYFVWVTNIITKGDFGQSFQWNRPVSEVIGDRLGLTMLISIITLIFVWVVSIPIGIYSATHQYTAFDYIFTFLGFIGLAVPGFLIALFAIYFVFVNTGVALTGLFSPAFNGQPWSFAKFLPSGSIAIMRRQLPARFINSITVSPVYAPASRYVSSPDSFNMFSKASSAFVSHSFK